MRDLIEYNTLPNSKIVVYGAGVYARRLMIYLTLTNCADLVLYFVVTEIGANPSIIEEHRVFSFEEKKKELNNSDIYIVMSEKKAEQVAVFLEQNGIFCVHRFSEEFLHNLQGMIIDKCMEKNVKNSVFFSSFNGKNYSCNTKYICENLIKHYKYEIYIHKEDPQSDFQIPDGTKETVSETAKFYIALYTSKIVVSNSYISEYFVKREGQYYINTWHGIGPTKKVGMDSKAWSISSKEDEAHRIFSKVDLMIAGSNHCIKVYRESFGYEGVIEKWGYPRNDIFWSGKEYKGKIINQLNLGSEALDMGIVLYAPTFRNGESKEYLIKQYDIDVFRVKKALRERFGKEFIFIYRFHSELVNLLGQEDVLKDGLNVTGYPDVQELLCAADVLISDWSSSIWDFSLTKKPVFLYYHDARAVEDKVGFYRFPDEYPYPKGHSNEELCMAIESFDERKYQDDLKTWFIQYGTYDDGNASNRVVRKIIEVMEIE